MRIDSGIEPCVVFLTGLSGAGKTTIAKALQQQISALGTEPVLLDGDEIRKLTSLTAFDEVSRRNHNLYVGNTASLLEKKGSIVIVALIAPYADVRNQIRGMCTRFIEVYLSTSIDECIKRDPKGLYAKAIAGEIKDFTGISAPYFAPVSPELIIDTASVPQNTAVEIIIHEMHKVKEK